MAVHVHMVTCDPRVSLRSALWDPTARVVRRSRCALREGAVWRWRGSGPFVTLPAQFTCTQTSGNYCPAGSFAATGSQCPLSYFCTSMAAASTQCGAGYYCPVGSAAATACAQGYYGASALPTYTTNACSGACTFTSGYYCPAASSAAAGVLCSIGSYCTSMSTKTACRCLRARGGGGVAVVDSLRGCVCLDFLAPLRCRRGAEGLCVRVIHACA